MKKKYLSPTELNPIARQAFGQSLIDIGVAIYKALFLLFTIIPITFILKSVFETSEERYTLANFFANFSMTVYLSSLVLFVLSIRLAHAFRAEGLRHINEAEEANVAISQKN